MHIAVYVLLWYCHASSACIMYTACILCVAVYVHHRFVGTYICSMDYRRYGTKLGKKILVTSPKQNFKSIKYNMGKTYIVAQ